MPLDTLTAAPFLLSLGEAVNTKVLATNFYGSSDYSQVGNGAVIVLVPDAPQSISDKPSVTLNDRIGL